ncbi:MAG: DUF938 domain-containing protein [Pseudomonadota bacterium]
MKPISEACERNKDVILQKLKQIWGTEKTRRVLEIGSGTGQHAVHFGAHLQNLEWVTTDLPDKHPGIKMWLDEANIDNVKGPFAIDLNRASDAEFGDVQSVYSANVVHIVPWRLCLQLFKLVAQVLPNDGDLILYGPFCYQGNFTSESNERFDQSLRQSNPESGIRNFEDIQSELEKLGLRLEQDIEMPANNRLLHFKK